jgi:hypothetical protein
LLSVTVMGLINQAAPPKLEPAEGHDERGGEKDQ